MSFRELSLLKHYKTYKNDLINDFYTPVLNEAVLYQRAVGFFSSTALIDLTRGITGLIKNKGEIQFIVSPRLSKEDIEAINMGYEKRKIIGDALMRDFHEPTNYFEEERLNWLAYLIESGILEIKVAFTPPNSEMGMYHEKVGILTDEFGNKIVFTGSMNETINAFHNNYESIVVFNSWEESKEYATEMQLDFEILWKNNDKDLEVIEFPKVVKDHIKTYRKDSLNFNIDEEEALKQPKKTKKGTPRLPEGFSLRDYQIEAIDNWEKNDYSGIFDMATGTGKTYTALGAIVRLFEAKKRLAIIVVCPYQHLVEQWVEDIELFNMDPIIGYSSSKQRKWKKKLQNDVLDFTLGVIDTFCFVTTNATYSTEFVCEQMKKIGEDTVLIVDEAHNFGAMSLRDKLYPRITYRLALSATLERHGDAEGTETLKSYFGEKCIEYDLKRAIKEKKLTPYYYYPVVVYLNDNELDDYMEKSYLASKECHVDKNGKIIITDKGKRLLLDRSRIIAGASSKLETLRKLIGQYKDDTHILIYCGATRVQSFDQDQTDTDDEGERQIVAVSKILGNEYGMKVTHFTSRESAEEREIIKRRFDIADPYQAIVAIKCLDEGVNIPSIKTAFILASTTNPKEYIQRRGRVLRLAKNKPYATIYDFVTLTKRNDEINKYSQDYNYDRALAKRELARIKEFGEIALNSRDADSLINELEDVYEINEDELEVAFDGTEL